MIPQQSPFDAIRHEDEQGEWWSARELAEKLGYTGTRAWQNFQRIVREAKQVYESQLGSSEGVFTAIGKNPTASGGRPSTEYDYRLTRYACYLVALSAEGSKNEVAAAKVYFAVRTREAELQDIALLQSQIMDLSAQLEGDPLAETARRIALREELSDANKALLQRAYEAGVITKQQLALFMNMGYKGLYDERTMREMQVMRGLAPRQSLSDYMSALDTFANYLRALLGKRNMQQRQVSDAHRAGIAHYDAGRTVRDLFLQSIGIAPEDLPRATKSYKQIVIEAYERIQRGEEWDDGL